MELKMKKLLPILLSTIIGLHAQIIDAIAIDVDGEPITTLEIQAVQEKLNMSKKAAIEALIKDRLEKGAIDRANIIISQGEIDDRIKQIAQARGLSKTKMMSALRKKGLTWNSYREQLSIEMKKEEFFKKHIASSVSKPTEDELKIYYETNREKFSKAGVVAQMSLLVYASNSSKKLQEAIHNPMKKIDGVQQKSILASSTEMNPKLFQLIQNTAEGSFTQPINTGRGFVAYYVKSKSSQESAGFEMVKNAVMMQWLQEERVKAGRNFYNKLKNDTNIRVIRL
jgi:parvulin-like peptidyl-prolyl isomerase